MQSELQTFTKKINEHKADSILAPRLFDPQLIFLNVGIIVLIDPLSHPAPDPFPFPSDENKIDILLYLFILFL